MAHGGGEVTSEGGAAVTARGVCWSTSINPTIADSHSTDGGGTGVFTSIIAGLMPATPYYVRAYATSSAGTAYGNEVPFTTLAQHTITASAGAGGSISPSGSVSVNHGADQSFTISPNDGYHIANVMVDGGSVGALTPYTFTNVTVNHTISVSFAINTYTLSYTANPNGSITGPSPQTVNYGSSGTAVTALPATGYHFVSWSDGSTANPRTDTNVTADLTVTANFAIDTYTITASAGTGGAIESFRGNHSELWRISILYNHPEFRISHC